MSKAKKQQFGVSSGEVNARSEYDDEELDFVKGSRIDVKIGAGGRASGEENGAKKDYNFTGIAPGKTYLHPPDRLIKGRVIYPVKYVGQLKVPEPRGSEIVKNAIDMVKIAADVRKTNNPGWDIPEVDLSVSIRSLMCLERGTKNVMHQHPIHIVSFSANDKRGEGNIFVYIIKPKQPAVDHICYVYECTRTQAIELTSTVGEAFELAYKKFLEAKKAQAELKDRLETASPEEKEAIRKQVEAIEARKAAMVARKREAAEKKEAERIAKEKAEAEANRVAYTASDITSIKVEGPPTYFVADTREPDLGQDPETAKQLAAIQKEVRAIETKSELEIQNLKKSTSVAEKWENFTTALEPFQSQQTQVKRFQMRELDDVIASLEGEISNLEEAFNWMPGKNKIAAYDGSQFKKEETDGTEPGLSEKLEDIEAKFQSVQLAGEELEIPELPANYVMDEFIKAREKANMPKQGTVMEAAGSWYQKHHD